MTTPPPTDPPDQPHPAPSLVAAPPPPAPARRRRTWIWIVSGAVVLAAGGAAILFLVVLKPIVLKPAELERRLSTGPLMAQFARAPQKMTCGSELKVEMNSFSICQVTLADGEKVPLKIKVSKAGADPELDARAAVIRKGDLEKQASDLMGKAYKPLPVVCDRDLPGVSGSTTSCRTTDTNGAPIDLLLLTDKTVTEADARNDMLEVPFRAVPLKRKAQLEQELSAALVQQVGETPTTATCADDLVGAGGQSTKCSATFSDGTSVNLTATVSAVQSGFLITTNFVPE